MGRRLLVTGAGSGASSNIIRSLRGGDPSLRVIGVSRDRFVPKKCVAHRQHLLLGVENELLDGIETPSEARHPGT
jgi:hypothetical protein